jgi:hypothetical protein
MQNLASTVTILQLWREFIFSEADERFTRLRGFAEGNDEISLLEEGDQLVIGTSSCVPEDGPHGWGIQFKR